MMDMHHVSRGSPCIPVHQPDPWPCRPPYLSRQDAHDGQGGNIQGDTRVGQQLGAVYLGPAADHIPWAAAGLDNDCVC